MGNTAKRGDILLYKDAPTFITKAEEFGEELEDGFGNPMYYHIAIALSDIEKIEADGHSVTKNPIDYSERVNCFRPPCSEDIIEAALAKVLAHEGESYDDLLIADDALRFGTFNLLHLPTGLVKEYELHHKVCSSLAAPYIAEVFNTKDTGINSSPEDNYLEVAKYKVW